MAHRRYVPKTYNNRRIMRIITTGIITVALFFVILFLILFFYFQNFVVEGQLILPWLTDDPIFDGVEDELPPELLPGELLPEGGEEGTTDDPQAKRDTLIHDEDE